MKQEEAPATLAVAPVGQPLPLLPAAESAAVSVPPSAPLKVEVAVSSTTATAEDDDDDLPLSTLATKSVAQDEEDDEDDVPLSSLAKKPPAVGKLIPKHS